MYTGNKIKLLTLFTSLIFMTIMGNATARQSIANDWQLQYPASSSMTRMENATGAVCQACHRDASGGNPWNAYGWAVRENINLGLPAAFIAVETLDSDAESNDNITEINASSQPGWTTSGNLAYFKNGTIEASTPPAVPSLDPSYAAPTLSGFWPGSAEAGSFIFIFGNNFMIDGAQPEVRFNDIQTLLVQVVSNDMLIAVLPAGDTTGPITVTTSGGVATTAPETFGTPPGTALKISGIWPGQASQGDIVFLFGENFINQRVILTVGNTTIFLTQVVDQGLLVFVWPNEPSTAPVCLTTDTEVACINNNASIP